MDRLYELKHEEADHFSQLSRSKEIPGATNKKSNSVSPIAVGQ